MHPRRLIRFFPFLLLPFLPQDPTISPISFSFKDIPFSFSQITSLNSEATPSLAAPPSPASPIHHLKLPPFWPASAQYLAAHSTPQEPVFQLDPSIGKVWFPQSPKSHSDQVIPLIVSAEHLLLFAPSQESFQTALQALTSNQIPFRIPPHLPLIALLPLPGNTPNEWHAFQDRCSALLPPPVTLEWDGVGHGGFIPNDPRYSDQWHHNTLQSPDAWELSTGTPSVIVAVLDTGISDSLSDLAGRSLPGYDYANNDNDPTDDHGHGTAVIGTVASTGNNRILGAGVDWNCKILPVKVLSETNFGLYTWWAQGINYAVENGAHVINLSAGGTGNSSTLTRAIRDAIRVGVTFVTITQNDGLESISYPGNLPEPITVGATDQNDQIASFSNWGEGIDLVAPGVSIYTLNRNRTLGTWSGTSFAAPLVTGTVSLLLSLRPELTPEQVRSFLIAGALDQVGDSRDTPGYDKYHGWGRLNLQNTLQLALTSPTLTLSLPTHSLTLQWAIPSTAPSKDLYRLQTSTNLHDWISLPLPHSIQYTKTHARWTEPADAPFHQVHPHYYRIRLNLP